MIHSYYLPILDIAHSEQKEKGENHLCTLYFVFNQLKRCKQWNLSDPSFTLARTGTDPSCNGTIHGTDRFPQVKARGLPTCFARVSAAPSASPDHEVEQASCNARSQETENSSWENDHKCFLYELLTCTNGLLDIYSPSAFSPQYTFPMHKLTLFYIKKYYQCSL